MSCSLPLSRLSCVRRTRATRMLRMRKQVGGSQTLGGHPRGHTHCVHAHMRARISPGTAIERAIPWPRFYSLMTRDRQALRCGYFVAPDAELQAEVRWVAARKSRCAPKS
eukprot:11754609-Alexandrium_andersonii.AAC.1